MSRSDQVSVSTFKPFDEQFRRRPLPPIPQELETYNNSQLERSNGGSWFRKYGGQSQRSSPRWNTRVSVTKSNPISRTGSEPNLLDEEIETEGKLSSAISLECLNIEDSQKEKSASKLSKESKLTEKMTFLSLPRRVRPKPDSAALLANQQPRFPSDQSQNRSIVTKVLTQYPDVRTASSLEGTTSIAGAPAPLRPPPPQRPSAEEIVYSFRAKSKRNSLIRRQRPISPKRRSGNYSTSPEILEEEPITTAGSMDAQYSKPAAIPLPAHNYALSAQNPSDLIFHWTPSLSTELFYADENVYDKIASPVTKSPTYVDMSRTTSRTSTNSTGDKNSRPSARGSSDASAGELYMNTVEATKHTPTTTPERPPPPPTFRTPDNLPWKETSVFPQEDNEYCLPQEFVGHLGDAERGEGVGAEEERNHYRGGGVVKTTAATQPTPNSSATSVTSPDSPDGVGYPFLDEVPTDLSSLTVEEVLQCLRWLNLHKYVETFRNEQVDGELLMSVDQQVLIEELGFKRFDAIKLEKFARHGWRPKLARASPNQQQQQQPHAKLLLQPEPLYTDV